MPNKEVAPISEDLTHQYYLKVAKNWAQEHEGATEGKLRALPFDTARFPEQELDHYKSPVTEAIQIREQATQVLSSILGPIATKNYIAQFQTVTDEIIQAREQGGMSVVLSAHLFLWDLFFMAAASGVAESDQTGRPIHQVMSKNWLLVNKLMAYEGFINSQGELTSLDSEITKAANILYVSPQTATSARHGVPEEIEERINGLASQEIMRIIRQKFHGEQLFLAPGGSGTKLNADGQYAIQRISTGTEKFIRMAKTILLACATEEGDIVVIPYQPEGNKKDQARTTMEALAALTQETTGTATKYLG